MPFFSRVFFAIACFFRVIFDGRFASAVEQTKVLPPASAIRSARSPESNGDRDERHAIPPDEVEMGAGARNTDSLTPPSSSRARDTIDDLVRKTPDDDDDDDDDSTPPVSAESHNTGLRRRSPPKPNTVPPPPDPEASAEVVAPATEPSPGTTLPPPSPEIGAGESSVRISVNTDSIDNLPADSAAGKASEASTNVVSPTATPAHPELGDAGYAPRERGALLLLALLQREGRFVDFLQQDVTDFDDEQIGAAARVVHEGCRKALKGHLKVTPIRAEAEGDKVTLAEGYDVQANKLVGNVSGKPPYKGSVQHRGWRAEHLQLPSEVGDHDPGVLAQAEVEL
jgi:hypothetical protein